MKRYHVSNNSGQSICLIGRRRIDFPKGSNVIVDLPDETVARLKRRYPLLRFSPVEQPAASQETAQAEDKPVNQSAGPEDPQDVSQERMSLEEFSQKAKVERTGAGWCAVTLPGMTEKWTVRITAEEGDSDAIQRAYAKYCGKEE